jgi:hypothetical protein
MVKSGTLCEIPQFIAVGTARYKPAPHLSNGTLIYECREARRTVSIVLLLSE